ncbi:hypothetical protein Csa_023095 [Cucumis sativus]|nr:hypothetical protein Csa_023095 [Cucumis sativus]
MSWWDTRSTDVHSTYVSSHWVQSCLEDGCFWDTNGHILYSPLPCCVPLPGFENIRFCVSQYDDKRQSIVKKSVFCTWGQVCGEADKEGNPSNMQVHGWDKV